MFPPENPIVAKTYKITAINQFPFETIYKDEVIITPIYAKNIRNFFFAVPVSAIAPSMGANKTTNMPAIEFAIPNLAVLIVVSTPTHQYCLKKIGKKPAIIVVAKAELAQSYILHPNIAFLSSICIISSTFVI